MKRSLTVIAALLMVLALLLPLAACGGKGGDEPLTTAAEEELTEPVDAALEETTEESGEEPADEETTTAVDGSEDADAEEKPVPSTPAEVLAAYTEVMNKAKKDVKSMRKLEYQQLGKDSNFESNIINNPTILEQANRLMTSREKAMEEERYTRGTSDMLAQLPVTNSPLGCMAKSPDIFSKATAKQLANGDIELTLVMKPENNPEPAAQGATTSPSRTGQVFSPMSKSGIDDILNGGIVKLAFFGRPPTISTRYIDCKSTLTYNPETMQIVKLQQDYNVRVNIEGRALGFMNITGYATLENVLICDQFKY